MGMSLSFEASVREAVHRNSKDKCRSPLCETKLWKAKFELRQARNEIERLQTELARAAMDCGNTSEWKYEPDNYQADEHNHVDEPRWDYAMADRKLEEAAVRVTLL
ncbi:uncharacterized protein LOC131943519 [Physella acuta]|uniref:uncharacterized protein LOC131943519 n=1 Tax=Physella acuta TaxID=109671 RepID=UPI0027DE856C|nr:uncharacterized protein LOC131943519 [Physella acuta]